MGGRLFVIVVLIKRGALMSNPSQNSDPWGKSSQLIFYDAIQWQRGVQVGFILTEAFHYDSWCHYGNKLNEALPSEHRALWNPVCKHTRVHKVQAQQNYIPVKHKHSYNFHHRAARHSDLCNESMSTNCDFIWKTFPYFTSQINKINNKYIVWKLPQFTCNKNHSLRYSKCTSSRTYTSHSLTLVLKCMQMH